MKFNIATDKLVGAPSPLGWSDCHDFTPASPEQFATKGHLISIISMVSKQGYQIGDKEKEIAGKQIQTRLHEEYFGKVGDNFDLLKKAVENVSREFTSQNESLNIIAAVFLDDQIFLTHTKNTQAWIVRSGKVAKILPSPNSNSATGFPQENDIFVLGTDSFFEKITPDLIRSGHDIASPLKGIEAMSSAVVIKLKALEGQKDKLPNLVSPAPKPEIKVPTVSPTRRKIANLIDKVLVHLPQRPIFVKEELQAVQSSKRRKVTTLAGALLLALLIVSIFFGVRQQKISNVKSKYQDVLVLAQHNLDEAKSLSSINPGRARQLILDAKSQLDNLKNQGIKDDDLSKLLDSVTNAMGTIAGLYQQNPTLYLDLSLISSGFKGDDIARSDERMVVLDRAGKRLVSIDIATKKTNVIAGPDIMPNAVSVAAYSDRNFVTADNGIWAIGDKAEIVLKPDWGKDILPYAYAGNLYILDKDASSIWRYQGNGGVFDPKQNWFGPGIAPSLSNIIAWTFDGNIWMLTKDGNILRFSQGSPVDFSLKDLDKSIQGSDIFTTQDSKYLYILDTSNARVLVVDKDGNYKAQYISDNIKNAKKIIVSEADKKIILLEADKLYFLDTKHLN